MSNTITKTDVLAIALQDAVTTKQPVLLPSYGKNSVPVSIVFSQEFTREATEPGTIYKDVYETDEAGNVKFTLTEREGITDGKGGKVYDKIPVVKERKLSTVRLKTGGKETVSFTKTVPFNCSNAAEIRAKVGEGLNEFAKYIQNGGKIAARSKPLHLTVKIGEFIFSTTSLIEGGVKLSKCYEKKEFSQSLFGSNFCRPLWKQLQDVQTLHKGLPLKVSDLIETALK